MRLRLKTGSLLFLELVWIMYCLEVGILMICAVRRVMRFLLEAKATTSSPAHPVMTPTSSISATAKTPSMNITMTVTTAITTTTIAMALLVQTLSN